MTRLRRLADEKDTVCSGVLGVATTVQGLQRLPRSMFSPLWLWVSSAPREGLIAPATGGRATKSRARGSLASAPACGGRARWSAVAALVIAISLGAALDARAAGSSPVLML